MDGWMDGWIDRWTGGWLEREREANIVKIYTESFDKKVLSRHLYLRGRKQEELEENCIIRSSLICTSHKTFLAW